MSPRDPVGPDVPTAAESPQGVEAAWLPLEPRRPGQVPLRCWWARPSGRSPRAGVLVLPEVFGLNGWVRGVAVRLAAEGYAALAVPLFARTAPDLELGYGPQELALGRSHKERTRTDQLLADLALAADGLQHQLMTSGAAATPSGLGCVGFCFGGHVALLAATLPQVRATADFYGAGVVSGRPGGGPPSLELVPSIAGTLWCICGSDDPLILPGDVAAIEAALAAANACRAAAAAGVPAGGPAGVSMPGPHRLEVLEGGHGFMCSARADHHPTSERQGWRLLLELLGKELDPQGPGAGDGAGAF